MRLDVRRRRTVDGERRHDSTHLGLDAREWRRRGERREQVEALTAGEDLDGDDVGRELDRARRP